MRHEDFIVEVAKRLDWPEEKAVEIIAAMLEVMSAELKVSNPVVIDGFGTLRSTLQPEYILVNPETKERHLMPPAMEIVFESPLWDIGADSVPGIDFTPDEMLYNDVNNAFSQFEPTLLREGVSFPGIPEIVAGEPEEVPEEIPEIETPIIEEKQLEQEPMVLEPVAEEPEPAGFVETGGLEEPTVQTVLSGQKNLSEEPVPLPPQQRSRSGRELRSSKRSSVWIPIAGGIAIVVASLFFFKGDRER